MLVLQVPPVQANVVMSAHYESKGKMSSLSFAGQLKNLKPERVWEIFEEISGIYRESGPDEHNRENNKEISNYLVDKLKPLGFKVEQTKEGSGKYNIIATRNVDKENRDAIILQAHMDMVCISDNKDPRKPIILNIDGDFLKANNRTLGADNGIGLAAALAIAEDPKFKHLPLQIVFTVDEETGMYGAAAMKASDLYGKTLINMDSETYGEITIGCAGMHTFKEIRNVPLEEIGNNNNRKLTVSLKEATGGHSGVDINKGRLNPLKALLKELSNYPDVRITSITGGDKSNSIPREGIAEILVPENKLNETVNKLTDALNSIKETQKETDPHLKVSITTEKENESPRTKVLTPDFQSKLLDILGNQLHTGMKSIYKNGDTKTSQNLGILNLNDGQMELAVSMRSSDVSEKDEMFSKTTTQLSELFGEKIKPFNSSPIWQPKENSDLTKLAIEAYKQLGVKDPRVYTCHGGLENAQFAKKNPEIDQISVGPDIFDPHTTKERVRISSVDKFYTFVRLLLEKLSNKEQ
jgi:dipeptidase D